MRKEWRLLPAAAAFLALTCGCEDGGGSSQTPPPTITTYPSNQAVVEGRTAAFSVTASGLGTLTYQWKKDGVDIAGATSASYTTPATTLGDDGAQFTCVVTNAGGSVESNPATLGVNMALPSITTHPADQVVTEGETATLNVTATGSGTLTYQWQENSADIAGATSASYTAPTTVLADDGAQFCCVVTNAAGSVTSNTATLTVNMAPPTITTHPASQTVIEGQTAAFNVSASGPGTLTYKWQKDGTDIAGATNASYVMPATILGDDGVLFRCVVTNAGGSVTSNAATLTVNMAPPTITTHPSDQAVTESQTATFSVVATGSGTLTYQWRKDGADIASATGSSYTTPLTTLADDGAVFDCVVTNAAGNVTSNSATLTVNMAPPAVTTHPAHQTVYQGETATFTVTATSSGPMSYQWQEYVASVWQDISGATSASYTTLATVVADDGRQFRCEVTNAAGSVTSNAATLTLAFPGGQPIARVSVDSGGIQGDDWSRCPSISADGRYVAFESKGSNLVAGDTNPWLDIFLHDRLTGETTRVSVDSAGAQGNANSYSSSISSDGRYVAFWSSASNLVAGDTNGCGDVFVHDRLTGGTARVSVNSGGAQANAGSSGAPISSDGRFVAFESSASNLVAGDTNGCVDVFVHDRQTGTTTRVSVDSAGTQGNDASISRSISSDGRYVAFESKARNLVPGDTNWCWDVFVHDRQTGETVRVSVRSDGSQVYFDSSNARISADGRYVAFQTEAATCNVFVHDRQTGLTAQLTSGNSGSYASSISGDGRYVVIDSHATNLVAGDTNGAMDVFVRDRQTGQTARVSVDSVGAEGNGDSYWTSISSDERYLAFHSYATNLVAGDTNAANDIFVAPNPLAP